MQYLRNTISVMQIVLQDQNNAQIEDSLQRLIENCMLDNRVAQKQLFDTYAGELMTLCRRYAVDEENAKDILQEGFIKVFTNLKSYKSLGSFEGWMKKIFIHTAIRYQKKFKTKYVQVDSNDIENQLITHEYFIDHLLTDEILAILDKLPLGYKTIFNLYAIEGYSHKEISEILKIDEGTSRSQLFKAKKTLKEIVGKQYISLIILLLFLTLV